MPQADPPGSAPLSPDFDEPDFDEAERLAAGEAGELVWRLAQRERELLVHNEQVKLVAAFLDRMATSCFTVATLAPAAAYVLSDPAMRVSGGVVLIFGATGLLLMLLFFVMGQWVLEELRA